VCSPGACSKKINKVPRIVKTPGDSPLVFDQAASH